VREETRNVRLRLSASASPLEVRLTGRQGEPLTDWVVSATRTHSADGTPIQPRLRRRRTDGSGVATFAALRRGRVRLRVFGAEYPRAFPELEQTIEFEGRRQVVNLRVVRESRSADLEIQFSVLPSMEAQTGVVALERIASGHVIRAATHGAEPVRLRSLPTGQYKVKVSVGNVDALEARRFDLHPGTNVLRLSLHGR